MIRGVTLIGLGILLLMLVWGMIKIRRRARLTEAQRETKMAATEIMNRRPYRYEKQQPRCYPIYKELQPGDDPRRADEK